MHTIYVLRYEARRSRDIGDNPMSDYRRFYMQNSTWFFTVNLVYQFFALLFQSISLCTM